MLTQRPRGTADVLPGEVEQWQHLEQVVRDTCTRYHYQEIRTPVFEHTELFQRGVGETTDIVAKEMYTFLDRGGRSVTLRPEYTAGVVRAFVENKLYGQPGAVKLFYAGPMFRYEKPQKGRWRQFHQYGVEALGADDPALDAEVIALNLDLLAGFGLQGVELELNSVGCPVCRPLHREQMLAKLQPLADRFCGDCQQRLTRNPLRVFDCKQPACQALLAESGAPTIRASLCPACAEHFAQVQAHLAAMDLPYRLNDHLVRGLDYYTRTTWECIVPGYSSVAGGGRYNGLVRELGGPETPGVGFAGGFERALLVLQEQGLTRARPAALDAFVVVVDAAAAPLATRVLRQLRSAGLVADRDYRGRGIKAQLKQADRDGARFAVLLGEAELATGLATVKDLQTGLQAQVALADIAEYVGKGGADRVAST
ncbi:MAG: histidine--tRNA ligase [Alicyclobacillus sp.]|nr:histidine--tRNA ligase [Alicyclobacillus sp.]